MLQQDMPNWFPQEDTLSFNLRALLIRDLQYNHNQLTGKLLTLVDASFADPEQRKAFKDIVKQTVGEFFYVSEWLIQDIAEIIGDKEAIEINKSAVHSSLHKLNFKYTRSPK